MAGSISLSLSQQFDSTGAPLNGGLLYFYAAGTTTPQSAYQDSSLTLPWPNPIELDSAGRVPPFYLADGQIKIRLTNAAGVTQVSADNLLVVGASSGSGTAPTVDPTTILTTGDMKIVYGTGVLVGFVRANGRTIGSATSGATERANADTSALFAYLWNADANLAVSGGRGASAAADFGANKTIAIPDFRGRAPVGLADMGNSTSTVLSGVTFNSPGTSTTLGSTAGAATRTLSLGQLPTGITSTGTLTVTASTNAALAFMTAGSQSLGFSASAGAQTWSAPPLSTTVLTQGAVANGTFTSNNTSGQAIESISPVNLVTFYQKL